MDHTLGRGRASARGSAARTGLAVAVLMALVSGGVVAYFLFAGPKRTWGTERAIGEAPPPTAPAEQASQRGGRQSVAVGASKGLSVQVASRSDPTRLAATITSKSLEPLEANRYSAESPESFVFLRDGRTIYVRADTARLYIPQSASGQPESGTLTGNVRMLLFERRPGGVDPARDTPSLTVSTDQLMFDLTAWEFRVPAGVVVEGPTISYEGNNLRLLLNQTQERVELLNVARSKELRLRSAHAPPREPVAGADLAGSAQGAGNPPTQAALAQDSPASGGSASPAPTTGKTRSETFYHATLSGLVHVIQDERSIESDALELWAHMIGGQLPPGAIAPVRRSEPNESRQTAPSRNAVVASAPAAAENTGAHTDADSPGAQPAPGTLAPKATDEVVITWTGPLEVRPLNARPTELAGDDVALRFTAGDPGSVRFAEVPPAGEGLSGSAARIDYGATSRTIALSASGPAGVGLNLARSGALKCEDLKFDLGSGVATIRGGGSVAGVMNTGLGSPTTRDKAGDRVVRWTDGAAFRLLTSEQGVTGALLGANMSGGVEAVDGGASLRGDALTAEFFPGGTRTGPMSRLIVEGNAQANDGRDGAMVCDHLDVAFARREDSPDQSDPAVVTAMGGASAVRAGDTLAADLIETSLVRDAEGRSVVADMLAKDGAVYEGKDGVWASAPEIRASATRRTVVLSGPGATAGRQGSSITGTQVELEDARHAVTVFGAGSFAHESKDKDGNPVHASASWTRSMTYEDESGVLEANGDTHASFSPDAWSDRELEAGSVRLEFAPAPGEVGTVVPGDAAAPGDLGPGRRVRRAEAVAASLDVDNGGRASVVSRIFEAAGVPGGRRLVEELRLEGDRIIADDAEGTVTVPSAGTLRVVDVRASPGGERDKAKDEAAGDLNARGAAKFEWVGSFRLDRSAGTATMREGVGMRHLPLDGGAMTELEGEEVVAHFAELRQDGRKGTARGRLLSASATGAVWARLGTKELTADRLDYLAAQRLIRAAANQNNDVTMFDPASPAPLKAKLLEWDLARDRVEVKSPGTIVLPR